MPKALKTETLIIILLVLVGFFLRIAFLSSRPPTYDEAFSLALAQTKIEAMIQGALTSFEPPFSVFLLRLWLKINQNLAFLRFLPTLLGTAVILIMGFVGKKLFDSKVGIIVSFLATFSPVFIFESTNIRMYALGLLESLLVIYFFLRFLKNQNTSFLIGLGLALLLGLYTHYYFTLTVFVLNLFFLINHQKYQTLLKKWLALQISLILAYLPLLWQFFHSPHPVFYPASNSFMKIPGVFVIFGVSWDALQILKIFPFRLTSLLNIPLFFLTLILLASFFNGLKSLKNNREMLIFFLLYIFLPLGLVFIVSALIKPLFGLRSFILFSPAYYLVAALGIARLKTKLLYCGLGAFLLISGLFLAGQYLGFRTTWADSSPYNFVKENSLSADVFVHSDPLTFLLARFYLGKDNQFAATTSWYPRATEMALGYNLLSADQFPTKGNRLWYFLSGTQYFNRSAAEEKQKELEKNYQKILSQEFQNQELKITLFDLTKR